MRANTQGPNPRPSVDMAEAIRDAIATVAKRLTAEIVGPSDSYNGGRLSGAQANGLAHLVVCTLLTQGWAVVRLPDSRPSGIVGQVEWPVTARDENAAVVIRHDGRIGNDGVGNPYRDPHHARSHAAALLAAAEEVFGGST